MPRRTTIPALAGVLALVLAGSASADVQSEDLTLDTFSSPAVQTSGPLTSGMYYFATVQGNFSAFAQALWVSNPPVNVVCGTPQPVMYPSTGKAAGDLTGSDPETVYATRVTGGCGNLKPPIHYDNFEINTGSGYAHREPTGGPYSSPTADHRYTYILTGAGAGAPAGFRQRDANYADNNGQYKISVRRGTGEDCKKGGWQGFGGVFKNQGDCVSFFATGGRNRPANA